VTNRSFDHDSAQRRQDQRTAVAVTVDVAGARMGGAARFKGELDRYLQRSGREDVRVIGRSRRVDPAWLACREMIRPNRGRRVALNNVSFVTSGSERWTLLGNALHFLIDDEASRLDPATRASARREAAVVRLTARRADMLVAPSTALAERVINVMPSLRSRVVVRPHPVSADSVPNLPREAAILCPVLFSPYKQMVDRIKELLAVIDEHVDRSVRLRVTADRAEVPARLIQNPRLELVGRMDHHDLRMLWARSRVIYFPTGLESFGYPLAEARVNGQPVIAQDTAQNREIAGAALCGFTPGDAGSLVRATKTALITDVEPDPGPFDPDAYFSWLLGPPR
jgi:glycosyltransferase involved in cell wall biosynthesis